MPFMVSKRAALVTSASPNYASGENVGGKATFSSFTRRVGGNGKATRLNLLSIDAVSVASTFYLFSKDPTNSTITDNAAFSVHASDLPYLLRPIPVLSANWVTLTGTVYYENEIELNIPFATEADSKNLFGVYVAGGAIDLSSTASIIATLGGEIYL